MQGSVSFFLFLFCSFQVFFLPLFRFKKKSYGGIKKESRDFEFYLETKITTNVWQPAGCRGQTIQHKEGMQDDQSSEYVKGVRRWRGRDNKSLRERESQIQEVAQ